MDGFIHSSKPYLLSSATCDEKIVMEVTIFPNCRFATPQKRLQGMTNNVGLTFTVGNTIPWFTII